MLRMMLVLAGLGCSHALTVGLSTRVRNAAVSMTMPSDDALFASLRSRLSQAEDKASAPVPLGPDEVGAEVMGPADVVDYCMRSLRADSEQGCKALMSFAAKADQAEDILGQLQPGFFSDSSSLVAQLASQPRYETLTRLSEFKCMGQPEFSNMARSAAQKLLVRRDGANWEDLFVNMQLATMDAVEGEAPMASRRWIITSIYKQGTAS